MTPGAGKYDQICTQVRNDTEATDVAVMVINGKHGTGFSVQSQSMKFMILLPRLLRDMADQIESEINNNPNMQKLMEEVENELADNSRPN